jgi:hypothetical protein
MPTGPANRVINYSRRDRRLGIASGHETGGGRSGFPTCSRRWRFLTPRAVLGPGGRRRAASGGRRPVPTLPACGPSFADRADAEVVNSTGTMPWSGVSASAWFSGLPRLPMRTAMAVPAGKDLSGRGLLPDPLAGPGGSCDFRVTRFPRPVCGQTTRCAASRLCDPTVSIRRQSDAHRGRHPPRPPRRRGPGPQRRPGRPNSRSTAIRPVSKRCCALSPTGRPVVAAGRWRAAAAAAPAWPASCSHRMSGWSRSTGPSGPAAARANDEGLAAHPTCRSRPCGRRGHRVHPASIRID